ECVAENQAVSQEKGPLSNEGAYGLALVRARRPQLHDVFPELYREFVAEIVTERSHGLEHVPLQLRRGAIVQGERTPFVLHQQSIEAIRDVGQATSRDRHALRAAA